MTQAGAQTLPGSVDMTPTWEGLLPLLLVIYEGGDRTYALKELYRMAKAADVAVATLKAERAKLEESTS